MGDTPENPHCTRAFKADFSFHRAQKPAFGRDMLSRRAWVAGVSGATLSWCWTEVAHGAVSRELFTLARSTNANVLKYAVRTTKSGQLETSNPVEAYWLMLAENGRREELTWAERQLAYGFSTSALANDTFKLRLTACATRELRVRAANGAYVAELDIARQPARLQRIFVQLEEHTLMPRVRHVEIYGITADGHRVGERIDPRRPARF